MIKPVSTLLAAMLLAAQAFAASGGPAASPYCQDDAWRQRPFALWITDETNPDKAACVARLAYASCEVLTTYDNATEIGESRRYSSAGYEVAVNIDANGAATVVLNVKDSPGQNYWAGPRAYLGTYPLRRVYQRGLGVDDVTIGDPRSGRTRRLGNVFFIPVDNLTDAGRRRCP